MKPRRTTNKALAALRAEKTVVAVEETVFPPGTPEWAVRRAWSAAIEALGQDAPFGERAQQAHETIRRMLRDGLIAHSQGVTNGSK